MSKVDPFERHPLQDLGKVREKNEDVMTILKEQLTRNEMMFDVGIRSGDAYTAVKETIMDIIGGLL